MLWFSGMCRHIFRYTGTSISGERATSMFLAGFWSVGSYLPKYRTWWTFTFTAVRTSNSLRILHLWRDLQMHISPVTSARLALNLETDYTRMSQQVCWKDRFVLDRFLRPMRCSKLPIVVPTFLAPKVSFVRREIETGNTKHLCVNNSSLFNHPYLSKEGDCSRQYVHTSSSKSTSGNSIRLLINN